jgi:hypothetical protein
MSFESQFFDLNVEDGLFLFDALRLCVFDPGLSHVELLSYGFQFQPGCEPTIYSSC